ncbi:hypothetical protein SUDANB58_00626 [Streptomyces sp. enrichment culture]
MRESRDPPGNDGGLLPLPKTGELSVADRSAHDIGDLSGGRRP